MGGGGIGMDYIQTQPHVEFCNFVHCSSGNDGGGISMYCSYSHPNTLPLTKCRFFCCYANSTANGDGGAIIVWENKEVFGFSNCLFSSGHSILRAGGTSFGFTSMTQVSFYFICFSFFTGNTAPNGNDICLYNVKGNPILHSFTTTAVNTLYNSSSASYVTDWLPLGTLYDLMTPDGSTVKTDAFTFTSSSVTHSTDTFFGNPLFRSNREIHTIFHFFKFFF